MTAQLSLAYPDSPGFKEKSGTSELAAAKVMRRAAILRERIMMLFAPGMTMTADEVAEYLHESILSVRPRVSELGQIGRHGEPPRLMKTLERRRNASGHSAVCWRHAYPVVTHDR